MMPKNTSKAYFRVLSSSLSLSERAGPFSFVAFWLKWPWPCFRFPVGIGWFEETENDGGTVYFCRTFEGRGDAVWESEIGRGRLCEYRG